MSSNISIIESQVGKLASGLPADFIPMINPRCPNDTSSERILLPPTSGLGVTFNPNTTTTVEIPTSHDGVIVFLDKTKTAHKFSVAFQTTAAQSATAPYSITQTNGTLSAYTNNLFLDNSAYSLIANSTVSRNTVQWEVNEQYNQYCNMWIDFNCSKSEKAGLSNNCGVNDQEVICSVATTPTVNCTNYVYLQRPGDRSGKALSSTTNASTSATNYSFELPVMSGIIGVNAAKSIQLNKFKGANIVHTIRWEYSDNALVSNTTAAGTTYLVTKYELNIETVTIRNTPEQYLPLFNNPRTIYPFKSYAYYSYTLTSTTSTAQIPIGIVASSVTGIYVKFRPDYNAVQGATTTSRYRLSSTCNPNLNSWSLSINGKKLPQNDITVIDSYNGLATECFSELMKSYGSFSVIDANPSVFGFEYNVNELGTLTNTNLMNSKNGILTINAVNIANLSYLNAFHLGKELELLSNRSDVLMSGIPCTSSNFYLTLKFIPGQTANSNYFVDIFVTYDGLLTVQDSISTVLM